MRSLAHVSTRSRRRRLSAAAVTTGLALAATAALSGSSPALADAGSDASRTLRTAVTPAGISEHLVALQRIADAHDRTRASGTDGYAASRDYVVDRLEAAGYEPEVQAFDFPFFEELAPSTLVRTAPTAKTYVNGTDFETMTYSGAGSVTDAPVVAVDTAATATDSSTSGCEASDFTGFPTGAVALVQRGTCDFGTKVANADAAGAAAVIVFNRGTEGNTDVIAGTLGAPAEIPTLGASFAAGRELAAAGSRVSLSTSTVSEIRETYNVTAEVAGTTPKDVVMAGAHLDSVVEGPGINDNGSGSATILEVAEQMAASGIKPRNTVRFGWWGAEEFGLLGSEHYVADLAENDPKALRQILLYLNFDMVGSPNYVRFVYDGDNSKFGEAEGAATGPKGSAGIEKTFRDYFASQGLASEETPFSGRSDYGPFIAEGIPAGGLFTGAEGVKTEAQAATYGGTAGVAYDKCYHQACDDLANVNTQAVDEMSDAVAHAVATYAFVTDSLRTARGPRSTGGDAARAELHPVHDHDLRK